MSPRRRRAFGSPGQAIAEFALVVPIIALLLFGIFDLGRAVYAYNTIGNAARVGARVAVVNQLLTSADCDERRPVEDPADAHWSVATCAAGAAVSLGVKTTDVSVSYAPPPGTSLTCSPVVQVGCLASVTVRYSYVPMTPVIGTITGTITLDATSQMPVERVFP